MPRGMGVEREMARLAISREFLEEFTRLDKAVRGKVAAAFGKFADPSRAGLNLEKPTGCKDDRVRTFRVDRRLRGVLLAPDSGDTYCLLAVLPHPDAYAFAAGRRFSVNQALGVFEVWDEDALQQREPKLQAAAAAEPHRLFAGAGDADLARLGVDARVVPLVRLLATEADLDALEPLIPAAQYDALYLLAGGLTVEQVWEEVAQGQPAAPLQAAAGDGDLVAAMERTPGQIAFIADRGELQQVLADPDAAWPIFVRPDLRPVADGHSPTAASGGVEEFRDRDRDYLGWVVAHAGGYVINTGRSGHGYARLHRAACATITSRPPFTGPYIKVCGVSLAALDEWALRRTGAHSQRCGICQPPAAAFAPADARRGEAPGPPPARSGAASSPAGRAWQIAGPSRQLPEVWLWAEQYIPFERLSLGQRDAREELRRRVRLLAAQPGRILHASYDGPKPANADVENLVLYNIDPAAGGCFQPAAQHGVRFEMAAGPRGDPPPGPGFTCSYRYRLISAASELSYWRPTRTLARFAGASLGQFPGARRLEQVWLAVHRADPTVSGSQLPDASPFAMFLTLCHPRATTAAASPELVKALIDGTSAAFHAHGDPAGLSEIAQRVAASTGELPEAIAQMLADDRQAVLGVPRRLLCLRGTGVQWMPGDHMCLVGQVLCSPAATADDWTLSGEILALEPRPPARLPQPTTS